MYTTVEIEFAELTSFGKTDKKCPQDIGLCFDSRGDIHY